MIDDDYAKKIPWLREPEMVETPIYGPVTSTSFTWLRKPEEIIWSAINDPPYVAPVVRPKKAWVLWHRYSDGPSYPHIERVYLDGKRAEQDYNLLTTSGKVDGKSSSSEWQLTELTITG